MNTQAATEMPTEKRRRRRSKKRASFAEKFLALVWPAQARVSHKIGTWLVVIGLVWLSFHAGSMGLAHLQVIRVENQLKYWYKLGKVPSPASLDSTLAAIERADQLHPDNPYQLTLQARVLEWRAYNGGQVIAEDYRRALALYQQAAALRPLWPDSWAEMAQVKVRLNEYDGDLDRYLTRAAKLGPYTPAVHLAVVQAGLPRLPGLAGEQRDLLKLHLLRGVQDRRSKGQVFNLIKHYGQQAVTCQWFESAEALSHLPGFCKS